MRLPILNESALIHHDYLVKIQDGVEFVRDGNDGMRGEFGAQEPLNNQFGAVVEASRGISVRSAKLVLRREEVVWSGHLPARSFV